MTDVLKKSNYPNQSDSLAMNTFHKKCEDGIFNNIDSADDYQLKRMMSYHFKFYTEFNTDKVLLKNKIKESVRDLKLKKILN
jgi:hypothetical protein